MDKLAFADELDPTKVVNEASEYHLHVAPVPKVPPLWVKVVEEPLQTVEDATNKDVGATVQTTTLGTTSPELKIVAPGATKPVNVIWSNCAVVKCVAAEPTKILPAVPEEPEVPVQPLIVKVVAAVQATP